MKVRDEAEWQAQAAQLVSDENPMAPLFHAFVLAWADAAEAVMAERSAEPYFQAHPDLNGPANALRATLPSVEQSLGQSVTTMLVGMALVVLFTHWDFGGEPQQFYDGLTTIEQRVYQEVALTKMWELAYGATQEQQS